MAIRDTIIQVLKKTKPTMDFEGIENIIDEAYLDSLELMSLITMLADEFGFDVDIEWITPENFNSIDAMTALVERLTTR